MSHDSGPVAESYVPIRDYFGVLSAWWHEATDYLSSPSEKADHPAYRAIIEMDREAVPFILEELRERGGDWYIALRRILAGEPQLPEPAGTTRQIVAAWIDWGMKHHYLA